METKAERNGFMTFCTVVFSAAFLVFLGMGFYRLSGFAPRYVGGDAYNILINTGKATAFFVAAFGSLVAGILLEFLNCYIARRDLENRMPAHAGNAAPAASDAGSLPANSPVQLGGLPAEAGFYVAKKDTKLYQTGNYYNVVSPLYVGNIVEYVSCGTTTTIGNVTGQMWTVKMADGKTGDCFSGLLERKLD